MSASEPGRARADRHPASFLQERMYWLAHDGRDEDISIVAWRMNGRPDPSRIRECVHELVARHEPLRTTLENEGDAPIQVIARAHGVPVEVVRLADGGDDAVRDLSQAEARRPVALEREPWFSLTVAQAPGDECVLVWRFSHACWDGFSGRVLERDFTTAYRDPGSLPSLPLEVGQLVRRERDAAGWGSIDSRARELATAPRLRGHRAQAGGDFVGAMRRVGTISAERQRALAAVAKHHRCTPATLLLAIWCLTLCRHHDGSELVVAIFDANRDEPGRELLIGCVVNVLLVPISLEPDAGLGPAIDAVRAATYEAYDRRAPLEHQLAYAAPAQRRGERDVADAMFNYQPTGLRHARGDDPSTEAVVEPLLAIPTGRRVHARGSWPGARLGLSVVAAADQALVLWIDWDALAGDDEVDGLARTLTQTFEGAVHARA